MNIFNKNTSLFMAGMLTAGMLASCSSNEDGATPSEGKGRLSVAIGTQTEFITRALDEASWKNASNYTVEITNKDNEVVGTYKASEIPSSIELENGEYTVHAFCGEEKVASRDNFLSEGTEHLTLNINDEKSVKVTCTPTCGKASVKFSADMETYFTDYYVTFSTPKMEAGQEATWTKSDNEPWYLAVSENGDEIKATIHLTPKAEYAAEEEGTVERTYTLQRNKAWTVNISPSYTSSNGSLGISIEIDDSTNDHEVEVAIPAEWI